MSQSDFESIADLYERLQTYVGWTAQDSERLRAAWPLIEIAVPELVHDFYCAIQSEPDTARIITEGNEQIARLKVTLAAWLRELFQGPHDRSYAVRRWFVGHRHVEISLQAEFVSAAMCRLRLGLQKSLQQRWNGNPADLALTIAALHRALDLDLALIDNAYQTEYRRRLQNFERLATIGKIAGGIAHELRNPLNVIRTSTYYLKVAADSDPRKKLEHLERIERQVQVAERVIGAWNDFARLPYPSWEPIDWKLCIEEAIQSVEQSTGISVHVTIKPDVPVLRGDPRQLTVVVRNLVANACEALKTQGGNVEIIARRSREGVEILVRDDGPGMSPEVLSRAGEPFFTTKAHGMGLGLALCRAILERHGARLHIDSSVGRGTTARVLFPQPEKGST